MFGWVCFVSLDGAFVLSGGGAGDDVTVGAILADVVTDGVDVATGVGLGAEFTLAVGDGDGFADTPCV